MILDDILNRIRYKQQVEIPRQDLVMLSLALFKEAEELENNNVGSSGKSAIEFLLNQKYEIIENPKISVLVRETILKEIDKVINKVVAKYHIKRKGKNFYFDESLEMAILSPDRINPNPNADQLVANIYAAQVELETLRIQLTRTNLQDLSNTIRIKQAILDKELEIKDMKKKLRLFSYFDAVTDQNNLYRRSLGESKKEATTGAVSGALIGAKVASDKFKKQTDFNKKRAKLQQTAKDLGTSKKAMRGSASEVKHIYNSGLSDNKVKKIDKLVKNMQSTLKDQRKIRKAFKKGGKQMLDLARENIKRGAKGAGKGALIGAGLGLGVAAIHKAKNETLLNKIQEKSQVLNTFRDRKGVYQLDTIRNRAKNILTPSINKRTTIASALLVGGVGISLLLKKAQEKGASSTIASIKNAINRVQKSNKYTGTQKIKIKNSGELAIKRIKQIYKKKEI